MAKMERQDQNSARGSILSSARIRYTGSAKTTDDMWYQFDVEDGTKRAPAMEQARPRVVLRPTKSATSCTFAGMFRRPCRSGSVVKGGGGKRRGREGDQGIVRWMRGGGSYQREEALI